MFLESEIELLKVTFFHDERILFRNSQPHVSKVYFIPKPKEGLGIDSMGEFATTFELSNQFIDEEGKPSSYISIAETLESAFNFSFGNAYKSKARVFSRKPLTFNSDIKLKPFCCADIDLNGFFNDDALNYTTELLAVTYILETDDKQLLILVC